MSVLQIATGKPANRNPAKGKPVKAEPTKAESTKPEPTKAMGHKHTKAMRQRLAYRTRGRLRARVFVLLPRRHGGSE